MFEVRSTGCGNDDAHPDLGAAGDIEISGYQFVAAIEEPIAMNVMVDLPPGQTRVRVPRQFLRNGDEFKFEILIREAGGNETVVESCFLYLGQ